MKHMPPYLYTLLEECTVRVDAGVGGDHKRGTGFFVARGWVLTCAHVVVSKRTNTVLDNVRITCHNGESADASVQPQHVTSVGYPDLALLRVDLNAYPSFQDHQVVMLDEPAYPRDSVYCFSRAETEGGTPDGGILGVLEGPTGWLDKLPGSKFLKIGSTQVIAGASGAPVLNCSTGAVCGVLKRSRSLSTWLGGWAVPISEALGRFPDMVRAGKVPGTELWSAVRSGYAPPGAEVFPTKLAFECDRNPQRSQFRKGLTAHLRDRPHRPFVCVVHGSEMESHEAFVNVIASDLSRIAPRSDRLELAPRTKFVKWGTSDLPPSEQFKEVQENLRRELVEDPDASIEALVSDMSYQLAPTVIHTHLFDPLDHRQAEPLLSFLKFWAEFPDLPPDRGLFVFVNIQYPWTYALRSDSAVKRFLAWGTNRRTYSRTAAFLARIADYVNNPAQLAFSLVRLDVLKPVLIEDAHAWVQVHGVNHCSDYFLRSALQRIHNEYRDRRVPMQDWATQIIELVQGRAPTAIHP